MTEQEENELICEKLLRWKRYVPAGDEGQDLRWTIPLPHPLHGVAKKPTPTFVNAHESGLLWDGLRAAGIAMNIHTATGGRWIIQGYLRESDAARDCRGFCDVLEATLPLAFRAVALAYLRMERS